MTSFSHEWIYIVMVALTFASFLLSYQSPDLLNNPALWIPFLTCPFFIAATRKCIISYQAYKYLNPPIRGPLQQVLSSYFDRSFCCYSVVTVFTVFLCLSQEVQDVDKGDILHCLFLALGLSIFIAVVDVVSEFDDYEVNEYLKDNRSIGAFWAHGAFKAYYEVIFDDIVKRMSTFEKNHEIQLCTKKLILVFPLSCNVTKMLDRGSENSIDVFGELENLEHDQGANINREYKNTVYKITEDFEEFYIVAEYPSSLNTLWLLRDTIDENDDIEQQIGKMSILQWNYHRDCFAKTLERLVKDYPCILLKYDDQKTEQSLSTFLKRELLKKGFLRKKR